MIFKNIRQCLSLILVVVMMLSFLPTAVFAADNEELVGALIETKESSEACNGNDVIEEDLLTPVLDEIKGFNNYYGLTTGMTDDDLASLYITAMEDPMPWAEEILVAAQELSEAELNVLTEDENVILFDRFYNVILDIQTPELLATTVTVLDGQVSITDTATKMSESDGVVTVQAKGGFLSQTTNTITISNKSGGKATLSFEYAASNYSSFSESSASGSKSVVLEAGGSYTMSIKGKKAISNNTATLTLRNFSLTAVADSVNVTFEYDYKLGSVAAGGATVTSGTTIEVSSKVGVEVVATSTDEAVFLGWVNCADNKVLSLNASFTLIPTENISAKPIFRMKNSTTGYWGVSSATKQTWKNGILNFTSNEYYTIDTNYVYLFDDLNKAARCAASKSSKYIVLLNDATLPAGDYTIPSGVTLLIPFDEANTLYTTAVQSTGATYTEPSAYRTLVLNEEAYLNIEGTVSLSAKHRYTNGAKENGGSPSGNVSFIQMKDGSNITVKGGGKLYAYGYITGYGNVIAKSGAKVYENFQIMDFRGGNQSTNMDNEIFPLSQYYVQNIEAQIIFEPGAEEYVYTTVSMQSSEFGSSVKFLGTSGAMFNIATGSCGKIYDGKTDRLILDINGDASISNISMQFGTSSINSSKYDLAVNNNFTIRVNSGTTKIAQDLALLPGSEIIVGKDATCILEQDYNVYVYDQDEWGTYCGAVNKKVIPINYAPSKEYTRTEADLVDAKIQIEGIVDAKGHIYTTAGGANICGKESGQITTNSGTQKVTYQIIQAGEYKNSTYVPINITPVKLLNANSEYVETANSTITPNTYTYTNGVWVCETHTDEDPADYTCDVCGKRLAVELVGRTLKYVDKINVICLFEFLDQSMLVDENSDGIIDNAGMVVWDSKESVTYNEDGSPKGYSQLKAQLKHYPDNPGYYYAETDGITTPNLHKSAYYAGYVKVGDQYYYSDVFEYGPSMYAYNMLEKETGENANQTTPKTKNLCVTLLNYISAAQQYFPCADGDANTVVPSESELVNIALDEITTGKDINADGALEDLTKFGVYDLTAPEKDSSAEANGSIFKRVGKNLYFTDTVNLAAMFEFAEGTSWSDSGTIFWTESQWTAMGENPTPDIENYGSGKLESPLNSYNNSSTIYYAMCPISIAPKDMADTKIYSMGYVEVNNVYQYSNVKAYGIEDYIANIVEDNKNAENGTQGFYMKLLAQQLYHYERAARAALLNQ